MDNLKNKKRLDFLSAIMGGEFSAKLLDHKSMKHDSIKDLSLLVEIV